MEPAALDRLAALGVALFVIGALGVVWRRNLLVQLLALQLQFGAAQLLLVAFGRRASAPAHEAEAQALALLALAVGVLQLVVGLAVVIALGRHRDSLDVEDASTLRW